MAVGKTRGRSPRAPDAYLASGTTSQIEMSYFSIHLADDRSVGAKNSVVWPVQLAKNEVCVSVLLLETLVAPHMGTILLSISALFRKNIGVIFINSVSTLLDLHLETDVRGRANLYEEGMVSSNTRRIPPVLRPIFLVLRR